MVHLQDIKPYKNISPISHIYELMVLKNWDKSELAEKLNMSEAKMNNLLDENLPIREKEAVALESVFGISCAFWLNLDKHYRSRRKKAD